MSDMPDEQVQAQLAGAAEVVTRHLDAALEECTEQGISREVFSAAVMATLMQAMQTSLGSAATEALRDMLAVMGDGTDRGELTARSVRRPYSAASPSGSMRAAFGATCRIVSLSVPIVASEPTHAPPVDHPNC